VGFVCLNLEDDESIEEVYTRANDTIQYAEHLEARMSGGEDNDE